MPTDRLRLRPSTQYEARHTPWALQTCLALQEVSRGWVMVSPLGQDVQQCDLWVTSLPLCGLSCWMGPVGLAQDPGG